ncbi:hypothetical protein COOONC_08066 [Cooperia oncophora]
MRNAKQPQNSTSRPATTKTFFKKHMSEDEIREGLANGTLLKGQIRINQKKFEEAFIDNPNGSEFPDIAVLGMPDRNRALQGDVVAIRIKPRCNWVVNEDAYKNWKKDTGSKQSGSVADESGGDNTVVEVVEELIETTASLESAVAGPEKEVPDQRGIHGIVPDTTEMEVVLKDECCVEIQVDEVLLSTEALDEVESCQPSDLIEVVAEDGEAITLVEAEKLNMKPAKKKSYRILSDLPLEEWCLPDDCLQKTAEVVGIVEQKNSRLAMGRLEPALGSQRRWAKFSPSDSRLPRMMIDAAQLPKDFFERPQDFNKFLFLAKIVEWTDNSVMARGSLEKELGLAGDIDAETEGLLITNNVDTREFSEEVIECLPKVPDGGWKIDDAELAKRRDLRDEIIFTIDPKTARDLDDALSISPCDDVDGCGTPGWEVSWSLEHVHTSDMRIIHDFGNYANSEGRSAAK